MLLKVFTQNKLYSRLSARAVHFYRKNGQFAFLSPFGGQIRGNVHLRLIGKLVVDFLLVITELFLARFKG